MSNWEEVRLSEISNMIKRGISPKYIEDGGLPIINQKCIRNNVVSLEFSRRCSNEKIIAEEKLIKVGDVLVNSTGAGTLGRTGWIKELTEPTTVDSHVTIVRPNQILVSDKFIALYLSLKENEIELMGKGATNQTELSASILGTLKINLPPLDTQKRIASILSNYDDLIENNLKRIKLLEETAQNIYKEWFVNYRFPNYEHSEFDAESGLPVGWSIDIIGNQLLTIKRNGKLKTDDYELEGKFPIIDQANGFIAGYTNNEEVVQDLHLPIVVFGDHTRRVKFVNFPFVSGADGTQLMFPKNENLLPAYFYLSINNIDLSNYAYARHYKFMKEQPIIIPDEKTLDEFNKKAYPMLEQTIQLLNYNQKLKEARDIMLPRLMNRTIEV